VELTPHVYLGLDLGKARDHSALVILERAAEEAAEFDHVLRAYPRVLRLRVRHAERIPLGTPYLSLVPRLQSILGRVQDNFPVPVRVTLAVDASGVGAPVFEMLQRARLGVNLVPIVITGGEQANVNPHGGYSVPRAVLLSTLRILFEKETLRIAPRVPARAQLVEELATVAPTGPNSTHDDLVVALALAAWTAVRHTPQLLTPAAP
jgi:hypothetical protein